MSTQADLVQAADKTEAMLVTLDEDPVMSAACQEDREQARQMLTTIAAQCRRASVWAAKRHPSYLGSNA